MDETAFFEQLREKTETAFQSSPVKEMQDARERRWNYSICGTPIRKERGVIFGLNWGGGGEKDIDPDTRKVLEYPAQPSMPDGHNVEKYGFISQSLPLLEKHLGVNDLSQVNYTNLCFFRSPNVKYLEEYDWRLSLPLFKELIGYIDPPWLLLSGTSGLSRLDHLGELSNFNEHSVPHGNKTYRSFSARLLGRPLAAVYHPKYVRRASLPEEVEDQLWAKACSYLF